MRHIEFIINTSFKNRFGNLYFLRFIYNNFKKKIFMGYKDFLNNVWGEKWVVINIKKILQLLQQFKIIKSKSTNAFYVNQLAYSVVSFCFFSSFKFKFLSVFVQRSNLKLYFSNLFFISLKSKINDRVLNKVELEKILLTYKTFKLL